MPRAVSIAMEGPVTMTEHPASPPADPTDAAAGHVVETLDAPLPVACLAAADAATERFCAAHPEMLERYAERGAAYTRHDFAYLFAWAVDAVALAEPATFTRNVTWLDELLAARDFPRPWYVASVRMAREMAVERGLMTEQDAVRFVDPGVDALEARS
jgi:hypothetical protein